MPAESSRSISFHLPNNEKRLSRLFSTSLSITITFLLILLSLFLTAAALSVTIRIGLAAGLGRHDALLSSRGLNCETRVLILFICSLTGFPMCKLIGLTRQSGHSCRCHHQLLLTLNRWRFTKFYERVLNRR